MTTWTPTATSSTVPTPCPAWCDAGGLHVPVPEGVQVQHERVVLEALPFGEVLVESWGTGEDEGEPPSLSVDLHTDGLDVDAVERLAAAFTAAAEQLRSSTSPTAGDLATDPGAVASTGQRWAVTAYDVPAREQPAALCGDLRAVLSAHGVEAAPRVVLAALAAVLDGTPWDDGGRRLADGTTWTAPDAP